MTEVTAQTMSEEHPRSLLPLAHFRLSTQGYDGTVEVNGQDIPNCRRAVVMLGAGEPATLQLELRGAGEIEGDGIVKVILDDQQSEVPLAQAVLRFLDSVDPGDLEQRALSGGGMSEGPAVAFLAALRAMALA